MVIVSMRWPDGSPSRPFFLVLPRELARADLAVDPPSLDSRAMRSLLASLSSLALTSSHVLLLEHRPGPEYMLLARALAAKLSPARSRNA